MQLLSFDITLHDFDYSQASMPAIRNIMIVYYETAEALIDLLPENEELFDALRLLKESRDQSIKCWKRK